MRPLLVLLERLWGSLGSPPGDLPGGLLGPGGGQKGVSVFLGSPPGPYGLPSSLVTEVTIDIIMGCWGGCVFFANAKYPTIFRGDMFSNLGMLGGMFFPKTPNTLP